MLKMGMGIPNYYRKVRKKLKWLQNNKTTNTRLRDDFSSSKNQSGSLRAMV